MKMLTKEEAAEELAQFYFEVDEDVRAICRITAANEDDPDEPLKLLKVVEDTPPMGILPLNFPPNRAKGRPFRFELAVVTPEEFEQIQVGLLPLPEGWQLGEAIQAHNTHNTQMKAAA